MKANVGTIDVASTVVNKPGGGGVESTLKLTVWSRDLVLCTDGPADLSERDRQRLERREIRMLQAQQMLNERPLSTPSNPQPNGRIGPQSGYR